LTSETPYSWWNADISEVIFCGVYQGGLASEAILLGEKCIPHGARIHRGCVSETSFPSGKETLIGSSTITNCGVPFIKYKRKGVSRPASIFGISIIPSRSSVMAPL
jgi:hypothetical protein